MENVWALETTDLFEYLGDKRYHENVCVCSNEETAIKMLNKAFKECESKDKSWFNEDKRLFTYTFEEHGIRKERWVYINLVPFVE